jgi:signal transduction histidine kinase
MGKPTQAPQEVKGDGSASTREASQATLSAIGDVSIAAADAVDRISAAPRKTRWLPVLGFLLLVYVASCFVAIYTLKSAPWVRAFLAPLVPVLIAAAAFWRRQTWKFRSRESKLKEQARQNALNSLAHETANGVNAIRANLTGFREVNPQPAAAEHLEQIDRALARIDAALGKSPAGSRNN